MALAKLEAHQPAGSYPFFSMQGIDEEMLLRWGDSHSQCCLKISRGRKMLELPLRSNIIVSIIGLYFRGLQLSLQRLFSPCITYSRVYSRHLIPCLHTCL